MLAPGKKSYDQPRQHIKKQRHHFSNKGPSCQSYGSSSGHVWMWELDYKESWAQRIDTFELWCWRRLLRVPWTAKRSNQSILDEISPEYSLEGLRPPDTESWLTEKDPDAGKDWRQKEKGVTKDEMVRQHHRLNWYESEQTPRDCEGQGSLAFWGAKSHIQLSGWTTTM